ncbi:hypothetical protein PYW07_017267 [Mythimna separata]|uniref:Glucose-methanol-choline oxidoreductase N-terminal domain-containing protein n=1 Tax=Mythimna separata TaxID=271217 RepID=A0AAD7YXF7_MYTSE|nr:hypothetical protein PYW07_017267 [Mythimna separata]
MSSGLESCLSSTLGTAQSFAAAVQYFAAAQCLLKHPILPDAKVADQDCFDYIVIGAGSSGSVVASRLSEDKNSKVLLIEAGDDAPMEADIPGTETKLIGSTYDWKYKAENNGISSQGLINGSVPWPRGKMFGGSSSINAMIYIQGNSQDYQTWYDEGNKEWSVEEVRRCFRKAECLQNQEMLNNATISEHYGHDGMLYINKFNNTYEKYLEKLIDSWHEIGWRRVKDLNLENVMTSGYITVNAANGIRQSTDRAYIMPVANRPNLKILKNTCATKVLINEQNTAYGVEVQKDGKKKTIYASREVILSAGPISSPQLLMLSGVGPAKHLQEHDIPVILDSPMVGQNLNDHSCFTIFTFADLPEQPSSEAEPYLNFINYLANRQGPLSTSDFIAHAIALYSTEENPTYANCQNHITIVPKNTTGFKQNFQKIFGFNDTVMDPLAELNEKHDVFAFHFHYLHHLSKGNISLRSNNPNDVPRIHYNYFEDPRDLENAAKGVKMATRVLKTKYFKSINAFLPRINVPACDNLELDSLEYWRCILLNLVATVFHPIATCKMGTDISMSVVDSRLRVHGVNNLRVIDSSIMPGQISGNTNAASIMIGERGAELVIEDALNQIK